MAKFFETFKVLEDDGSWSSAPYPLDTLSGNVKLATQDICDPPTDLEFPEDDVAMGVTVSPFALTGYAKIPPRCAPRYVKDYLDAALIASTEYSVSKALWEGPTGVTSDLYLKHAGVEEIPRTGDAYTLMGAALARAFEKTPFLQPVIHLGFQSAMALQFGLNNLGLPFVVPNGYPAEAIAITGPIVIRLGSLQANDTMDMDLNRQYFETTRLAAIEFDPAMVVRVADS